VNASNGHAHVVIVGAGHAGGSVAALLRQYGYPGPITLVGDEQALPYQRPPLSKAWLKGEADADSLALRPAQFYAEQRINLRSGLGVTRLERASKTVTLEDGLLLPYDHLVLATGARAFRPPIPGSDLQDVLVLRTAADAECLKRALGPGRRLVVVGGGYIGLEVAASARALGSEVVVVEREPRLLARVAAPALSAFFKDYHERKGVDFILGKSVTAVVNTGDHVSAISLSDNTQLPCDVVLFGIGAIPNDELARCAGLDCERGIVVDLEGRSSDPAIFAIGDVAYRPLPIYDRMFRLESVPNAIEQAKQVACAITGRAPFRTEVPWFWSDQYDLKLQIAGLPFDADQVVIRGDPSEGSFAVFHLMGDKLRAVEAVNAPPEFMAGKQLIANRTPISPTKLADPTISMKEVAA
jgi:3-phenylpropionate/trans-cinnamate dioxygenase ferredoxin reductase subunit